MDGDLLQKPANRVDKIFASVQEKEQRKKEEKKQKKKEGKQKPFKSKKKLDLELYDTQIDNYNIIDPGRFDPFLRQQSHFREGVIIPKELQLGLYDESGFFFGMTPYRNVYAGKPAHEEGHILGFGLPGSGKTNGMLIPTMLTWRGIQIIVDVKGDLKNYWYRLARHTGKKLKIFSPGADEGATCGYDPFALFRHDSIKKLAGNVRDLALALIPLMESVKDPVWIKAAQNFLSGAFAYYFGLGATFAEAMIAIQLKDISEIMDDIMADDGDEDDQASIIARLYMSKLRGVQEKVVANIGMELGDLANLIADPAIMKSYHDDEICGTLDWLELTTTTEPFDVILEFPEENLEQWRPLMMLMINQLIKVLERRQPRTYDKNSELPPVLVMLDEFPRLGKISAIKEGLATLRSRGVTFALFVQDLAQILEVYGSVSSISSVCAYKVVLNSSEPSTQKYCSDLVGTTESTQRSVNVTHDPISGRPASFGKSISETRETIIYPEEFLTQKDVVVINPHNRFFRVDKTLFAEHEKMFLYMAQQGWSEPTQTPLTRIANRLKEEQHESNKQPL